ncbi:hypothetical protein FF1_035636 [Malus domestica]
MREPTDLFGGKQRVTAVPAHLSRHRNPIQDTQKPGKESPKPKYLESLRQRGTEHPDPSEVRSTHPPCPKRQLRALHRRHQNGRRQERRRFDPEATDGPDRSLGRGNPEEDLCQPPREATRELRLQLSVVLHKICV